MIETVAGFGIIAAVLANTLWWKPESGEFFLFLGVIFTAFFSFLSSRRSKDTQNKVKDVTKAAESVVEKVDTGNGKDIGTTVHDMSQTIEFLVAQVNTNTKETIAVMQNQTRLADNQARIEEKLDAHMNEANRVHRKLLEIHDEESEK